jgi:hypothetical protein
VDRVGGAGSDIETKRDHRNSRALELKAVRSRTYLKRSDRGSRPKRSDRETVLTLFGWQFRCYDDKEPNRENRL